MVISKTLFEISGELLMVIRGRNRIIVSIVLLSLILMQIILPITFGQNTEDTIKIGPYVDKVLFKVITQEDQQVLALQDDEIDLIGDWVDPRFLDTIAENVNLNIFNTLKNGYGYLTINCNKYPLNLTAFRRALAFAFDKEAISDDIWEGYSQPLDSCIPAVNPFTIEGQLPYNYYSADIEEGNNLLDRAGFNLNETTGYRMAPDGSAFDILVETPYSSYQAKDVCQMIVDTLTNLRIEAEYSPYWPDMNRLYFHGDYDIFFLSTSMSNFDVDWLAYDYWSEYADKPYWNFANFRNETYDSWRDQLLHSTSYDEVYEAAIEMQKILVYECPEIVCYEDVHLSVFRIDRFTGWINDAINGAHSWWNKYQVRLKPRPDSPIGGILRVSNALDIDSFNFMTSNSQLTRKLLNLLYDSLIKLDPVGSDIEWLAESYVIETHSDSARVPEGHTRITFNIVSNAIWSDGIPLTSEDVAFTLNYYRESSGNPYGRDLVDMIAAYTPTPSTVVIEFDTESFWHLHSVGYLPIIPRHIFEEMSIEDWNLWNPNPPDDAMVNSGPFNVSDYEPGEYIELTRNPEYFFAVNATTTTTSQTNNANLTANIWLSGLAVILVATSITTLELRRRRMKTIG